MDSICCCFQEQGSPGGSDNDDEETEKWAVITQQIDREKRGRKKLRDSSFDTDEEKVKEYGSNDETRPFNVESSDDGDDDDDDDEEEDDDESDMSDEYGTQLSNRLSVQSSNVSELSTPFSIQKHHVLTNNMSEDNIVFKEKKNAKYANYSTTPHTTLYENESVDSMNTNTNIPNIPNSVTTSTDSPRHFAWDEHEHNEESVTSLNHTDSLYSTTMTMENSCMGCMNLEHRQKQLDIQLQTIGDRNNELEDIINEAQTNEENSKRLYDELKEDFDRLQIKYDELHKREEVNKMDHDNVLQDTRNKLESDIINLEKNFQELLRSKNELEINLSEEHDKLEETENNLMNLENQFSTLNITKSRIEDDFKMEKNKMESLMNEYQKEIEILKKDKNGLLSTIKTQKLESATERQNNQLTLNILKEQMKKLHGEIAEIEEEKKALEESVNLYETQMKAEQLMDTAHLDLIREENDGDIDDDDDDELTQIIPEDEETELSQIDKNNFDSSNIRKRNSKSHDMSISQLEPAFPSLPRNQFSGNDGSDLEEDSIYIHDDIDNDGNMLNLSNKPSLNPNNLTLSPIIMHTKKDDGTVTPPQFDLSDDNDDDNDDDDKLHTKMLSDFDENQPTPVPSDKEDKNDLNLLLTTKKMGGKLSKSTGDIFKPNDILISPPMPPNNIRNKTHSRHRTDNSLSKDGGNSPSLSIGEEQLATFSLNALKNSRSHSSLSSHKKSSTGGHIRSNTRQELNVWKDKYAELKSKLTTNAKEMAMKDIELQSLNDKIEYLQSIIRGCEDKIQSLTFDLETSQSSYLELVANGLKLKKQHSIEMDVQNKKINKFKDEIATLSLENDRYLEWKNNIERDHRKKEKLYTKQLKFNEELMNEIFDLNNEVKQLTDINIEMKSRLESLIAESSSTMDEHEITRKKLEKSVRERKEDKLKNVRLKNKVSTLNKEIMSLNVTISNLESLFNEHSHLLQSKNRRIKHLGKQSMKQEESISRLSSKLKKKDRYLKGFMEAEEESFRKSYSAKDKRLDMLRARNIKLVSKIEESDKTLSELNILLKDTKLKLKDEITNHRMDNKKFEVKISKLISDNNKIIAEKQEIQYERDNALKINAELISEIKSEKNKNNRIIKQIDDTIESIDFIENNYFDILTFLDSMDMKEDNLYKFIGRCRNTFINTNKLTNKLIIKLIEGCDRAIGVYHISISHFKLLIDNCLNIKKRFKNIEKSYKSLEFHCYEVYQSALCSIYNIGGSSSAAANIIDGGLRRNSTTPTSSKRITMNSIRSTKKIVNAKNKDVIPKIPLIAKDLIRKPIQRESQEVPIAAYNQIYKLLSNHIQSALKNIKKITDFYQKPLDLSIYNGEKQEIEEKKQEEKEEKEAIILSIVTDFDKMDKMDQEEDDEKYDDKILNKTSCLYFDDEASIDWLSLTIDPKTQRLYPDSKEINDKRFDEIINEFNDSSKEFRKEQTKTLMELDGAWHQFHVAVGPNNDLSPKLSSRLTTTILGPLNENNNNNDDEKDNDNDNNNNNNKDNVYLSQLTLNVSSVVHGDHNKRYSIV